MEKLKAELAQEKKRTTMAESKSDTNLLNIQSPVKPSSGRKSPQRISGTNPPSASSTLNFSSEDSLDLSMIQVKRREGGRGGINSSRDEGGLKRVRDVFLLLSLSLSLSL